MDIKETLDQLEQKLLSRLNGEMDTKAKEVFQSEIKASIEAVNAEIKAKTEAAEEKAATELKAAVERMEKMQSTMENLEIKMGKMNDPKFAPRKENKSFNDVLQESIEAKHDDLEKFIREGKKGASLNIELKAVGDVTTANVTGGTVWGAVYRPGIIENPKRKVHMRQVIPGGNIGPGTDFYFMKEDGNGEGAIAPVAEGALKPQIDVDLVESSVKIETIAGWLRLTNKAMNNIPGMISFLQSRLPEKLLRVEDAQVLYGTGVSPELKGILTAGNFTASTAPATEKLIEKLITDISVLEDTYERDANGILLRPKDYYSFFKNKADGSGEYDLPMGVTFVGGQLYLFGIPVNATTALTGTDYIVGDFAMGAQLLTQEGMRIEFFKEDGTNVRENKVTVRIEETVALPVYGSDYFIKGDTTYTPPVA